MKFSRLLAVTIPFLLSSPFLFGQPSISPPSSGNLIFDEVKSQIELYYDSVPISTSEDSTFIKEYMRWSRFWDGRLDMDGTTGFDDFPSLTAIQNAFPCTGQNSNQLWEAEGPLTRPNYVSSGAAFRGIGRIDPIAYDPTSGVIIVGSPGGALLKSIDNGSSWSSLDVNIDYGYPALGIRKILIDPTDPDIIYIATGHDAVYLNFLDTDPATWTWSSGLFKSIDGGLSWDNITPISERKGLSNMFRPIYDMEFLPSDPNTIFWTMDDKLFVTYDAGMTHSVFKSSNSGELFDEVEVVMNGTDFIVYVTSRIDDLPNLEIQRYTSSNSQWTNVVAGVPILLADTVDRVKIQTSSSSPNEVFMIYRAGKDTLSFVSSLDFGLNWSNPVKIRDKGGLNFNAFDVSHQNSNVIYLATRFGEFRSLNKGLSFTSIESYHHDDNRWVQIIGHSSNLNPSSFIDSIFIAHDGGVTRLTGNGSARSSVDLMNSAFNVAQGYDLDIGNNGSKVIVTGVHDDGTMFGSKSNWYKGAGMGGDGGTCEFLKNDKKLFFINNWALGIYDFATDTSKFFLDVCGTLVGIKERYCIGILSHNLPAHYSPQSENIVYMGYDSLYMLDVRHPKSEIWKNRRSIGITNKPAGNTSSIRHIDICESDTSVMYITTGWRDWKSQPQDSSIYKTTDGGLNWVNISVYDAASWGAKASSIKVDPYDPDQVWVVFNGYKSGSPGNPNINQKVYHSINGGQTWQNISYNIPNISVNDIEIVPSVGIPGQYDLFIATDVGVYFKEAGATVWDCFSQGLSRSFFTRLRYNSCDNRLYVSSYGKGVWSVEVPSGRHVEYRITHDETWNTYRQVSGDIIIEPGATLTIENCTISMAKGARILVASNQGGSSGAGKLIVNNATLTNNCGQHWSGIDVAGDSYRGNMSHQYTYQGLSHVGIAIINNSIIEHAEIAIENWSNGNWSSFGGRIHAENTIFRNNRRAVGFGSYKNHAYWDANKVMPYMSSFAKCTFTIDDNFREEVDPHMGFHVTMWDVQGISFLGCSFKYDVANYRQAKELSGVYSIDATYNIFPYEYSLVGGVKIESLFENLHYGVHAMGGGSNTGNLIVEECLFKNNEYGIGLHGVSNAVLVKNKIRHNASSLWNTPYGIWARQSDPFTIEQNTFRDDNTVRRYGGLFGIIIEDCGPSNNVVYKNAFANALCPLVFLRDNFDPSFPSSGAKFRCNVMDSLHHNAWAVRIESGTGISRYQGALNNPADNTFDFNASNIPADISNDGTNGIMTYYHSPDAAGFKLEPVYLNQVNAQVSMVTFDPTNNCISNIRDQLQYSNQWNSGYYNALRMELAQSEADYTQSNYLYQSLIDGGETEELIADVQTSNTWDAWNLRNELIASSPLSTDVLMELIEKNTLSNALLFDVLMQNPHASRHEEIIHLLQTKPNPFPAYMMTLLAGMEDNYSQKDLLEAEMSRARADQYKDLRLLSMHYFADTIIGPDSLWSLWSGFDDPKGELQKVLLKRAEGQKTIAQQTFDQIPSNYQLTESMQHQWNSLDDYYTHYDQLMATDRTGILNEETVRSTFYSELNNTRTLGGRYARNWEKFALGETYTLELSTPGSGSGKRAAEPEKEEGVLDMRNLVKVYPNPAREYFTIEFNDELRSEVLDVQLISIGGQVVRHLNGKPGHGLWIVSLDGLSTGVYTVLIQDERKVIFKEQLSTE